MDPLQFFWPRVQPGLGSVVEARRKLSAWGSPPSPEEEGSDGWSRVQRHIVTRRMNPLDAMDHMVLRDTDPLDQTPALWLALARVADEPSLLAFVSKYGPLRWPDLLDWKPTPDDPSRYMGESMDDDLKVAADIRRVRDLWRALRDNDDAALGAFFDSQHPGFLVPPGVRDTYRRADAGQFIAVTINAGATGTRLHVEYVEPVVDGHAFWHSLVPDDLVAAAWAQVARAVGGGVDLAVCERDGCGAWYEIHPSQTRSDRAYCSNACKQAAYRNRKAKRQPEGKG